MRFSSSPQSTSWFRDRYKEGTLALRPPYQRKPVWAARQKCYLIESVLLGMPVPEIFIHQTTDADGNTLNAVVDGQQRIRTVLQFVGVETEIDEQEFTGFALDKLDPKSPYLGMTFAELPQPERVKFFEYEFHVRLLRTDDEAEMRSMFARLNRFLTALNAQELRNATYTGPFAKLAEELADNPWWLESGLITRALVRRLGDIEYASQLLIGVMHGPQGGGAAAIDLFYRQYEDYDLEEGFPDQRRMRRLFDLTLKFTTAITKHLDAEETRWMNKADFYSLFVAMAQALRTTWKSTLTSAQTTRIAKALEKFGADVDRRLGDEKAHAAADVVTYVRAIEKGVNDKKRRGDRHLVLLKLLEKAAAE
jgi:Protein of unknown function DUF262